METVFFDKFYSVQLKKIQQLSAVEGAERGQEKSPVSAEPEGKVFELEGVGDVAFASSRCEQFHSEAGHLFEQGDFGSM